MANEQPDDERAVDPFFDTIKAGRVTDSGRACVEIARGIFADGDSERRSSEARQWIKLGLDCDNATTATKIKAIEEKLRRRLGRTAKKAAMRGELKAVDGGKA